MNEGTLQDKSWLARQPLLMNLSADTLAAKAQLLQQVMQYTPQQLLEMLNCKPGILLFSNDKIRSKRIRLQELAGASHRWTAELSSLSPATLVQILTASDKRLGRLAHVVEAGEEEQLALGYLVRLSGAAFKKRFQGYTS
eukprot:gene2962-3247_t